MHTLSTLPTQPYQADPDRWFHEKSEPKSLSRLIRSTSLSFASPADALIRFRHKGSGDWLWQVYLLVHFGHGSVTVSGTDRTSPEAREHVQQILDAYAPYAELSDSVLEALRDRYPDDTDTDEDARDALFRAHAGLDAAWENFRHHPHVDIRTYTYSAHGG